MLKAKRDLTGEIFGRWKVICQAEDYISPDGKHKPRWFCECSCEEHNQKVVSQSSLIGGLSQSCGCIKRGDVKNRIGHSKLNNQGSLMKIVKYNKASDIVVEFQDEYKHTVHTTYSNYKKGNVKNLYYPEIYGVAMIGSKYSSRINGIQIKEYKTWFQMIRRCFDTKYNELHKTYEKVTCCDEWLLFENFYEWIHSQENFDKWLNGERWSLDKDILVKGNKVYSPETCCLVPMNVNALFERKEPQRGEYPIGVTRTNNGFAAQCSNPFDENVKWIGNYETVINTFNAYKRVKESYIRQVAQIEYEQGNITKKCYEAMMNYEVEITD